MKSRPFFNKKGIRFFFIAVPVLVAAVLLVDAAGRPPRIDLDEVACITVTVYFDCWNEEYSVTIRERELFEETESLERSLGKKARRFAILKCVKWSVSFAYHYKDQSVTYRRCSGNRNFDEAKRLIRTFMDSAGNKF